ncbi:hypothetical protein M1523_02565 [Patescibacteria group bacterium]|nr:hypothetical protein [Patescibacteria group bacterium]MCL5091396.1 hypothetical protein [Patescibacteria group bacterium]
MKKIVLAALIVLAVILAIVVIIGRLRSIQRPVTDTTVVPTVTAIPLPSTRFPTSSTTADTTAQYRQLPVITPIVTDNFDYQQSTVPVRPPPNLDDLKNGAVYDTDNLKISYSSTLDKYVLTRKTYLAQKEIDEWTRATDLIGQINNPALFVDQPSTISATVAPSSSPTSSSSSTTASTATDATDLTELFRSLFSIPIGGSTADNLIPTLANPAPLSSTAAAITPVKTIDNLVYFAQCNGQYDQYPLPQGCTLCQSGCGPTTATMVIASYAQPGFVPPTTVDYYRQQQFTLGCAGSKVNDLKQTLNDHGVATTPYLLFNGARANQIVSTLKQYLADGWTLVTVGEYADNSPSCGKCGHFFWVIDVDANDNVWALDPFYGRFQNPQPFNENSLYPYPKYVAAFGVKANR